MHMNVYRSRGYYTIIRVIAAKLHKTHYYDIQVSLLWDSFPSLGDTFLLVLTEESMTPRTLFRRKWASVAMLVF